MSAQQGDDYINYNCGDCLPYIALHMCTCALTCASFISSQLASRSSANLIYHV